MVHEIFNKKINFASIGEETFVDFELLGELELCSCSCMIKFDLIFDEAAEEETEEENTDELN